MPLSVSVAAASQATTGCGRHSGSSTCTNRSAGAISNLPRGAFIVNDLLRCYIRPRPLNHEAQTERNSNQLPICHADYEAPRPVNETAVVKDPDFAIRSVAMQLYYAQLAYLAKTNRTHYISDIGQLAQYAPLGPAALNGTCR